MKVIAKKVQNSNIYGHYTIYYMIYNVQFLLSYK